MREIIWVEIPGHPNYEINNYGEIIDLRTNKILKPYVNSGYLRIWLNGTKYYVHQLMMLSFYPDEENRGRIAHIDGDNFNNCLWNLEYKTNRRRRTGIVRCKYCKHRYECDISRCEDDDFYCADGEFR